ncbi:MAG: hypothetical protein JNK99_09725 [Candidatus Accumulibacter sp.]|uniref:lipopolysaccharide kinase InaA family protein n=1 Tax=Accumulibacter sp. TaxID=2053492 RepID=UPI001A52DDA4|nr:lipopolysaccharide kinase InaA family protein [Accumulibacter sp.]MBL8395010.1 hypothetical protein [Accumulibacter sp.]
MTTVPWTVTSQLRLAGREPAVPFRLALADGRPLIMRRLLRVLPAKRLVGEAEVAGRRVLAKLFIGRRSERHWQRERAGLEALRLAGVPTPVLFGATPLADGGHALLSEFLDPAESLAEAWQRLRERPPGDAEAVAALAPALGLVGRLHAAGLVHDDLHLGNFLRHAGSLLIVDGDAVRVISRGRPLAASHACANLAVLLAQLPAEWDRFLGTLLPAYAAGALPDVQKLTQQIERVRNWRLNDYLAKTVRECSLFAVEHDASHFSSVLRQQAGRLAALLADPDGAISRSTVFKDGGTCTVARVTAGADDLLVKRYNLKSLSHALSRAWRPSRAWHSWREAHRLQFVGIATPLPLALIEERLGPLRRRAWLVSEFCPGPNLLDHLAADREPPAAEARAILALFETMHRQRISHGDLKATNLLWHAGRVVVIDLDAMRQHRSAAVHARAWRRDRARLLRNWPPGCVLYRWLDERLPPA